MILCMRTLGLHKIYHKNVGGHLVTVRSFQLTIADELKRLSEKCHGIAQL